MEWVAVPQESPELYPFPFAAKVANETETVPLPDVGAVQSTLQLLELELAWVTLLPLINTPVPALEKLPLLASNEKPPLEPETPPVRPICILYVCPELYVEGKL